MLNHIRTIFRNRSSLKRIVSVVVVCAVAALGTYLLAQSHAATPYASSQAANGSLSGSATLQTDDSASGGSVVQFGGSSSTGSAPTSPPVTWCEDSNFPGDQGAPTTAPAGAVTVPTGDNSSLGLDDANTTYWFAAGTHTGVSVQPDNNDTYIGAPGAIINGQNNIHYAFVSNYEEPFGTNVTIEYLTIENYTPPGSAGAVDQNGGPGWTLKYDTLEKNVPGAGMMVGNNMTIENSCLTNNGEYGFNGYSYVDEDSTPSLASQLTGGPHDIVMNNNEISYNNTCDYDETGDTPTGGTPSGCEQDDNGDAGGGKFWHDQNVTLDNNYIHDNYGAPGVWADSSNDGFTIEGNYFSGNWGPAVEYEVSYNALIENNTFISNAVGEGPTNPNFPTGAIYLSESGGDSRATNSAHIGTITITGDTFTNNWAGVVLWENSNRFCGGNIVYGQPDSMCTLVSPTIASSPTVCANALENSSENQPGDNPDYFDLCRWKTQNVAINHDTFTFSTSALGSKCTAANGCGVNAIFSNYGSGSDGVPYKGAVVPINITFNQNNVFADNTYKGPWKFFAWAQSNLANPISWTQWTAAVTDKCSTSQEQSSGTCNSGFGQDAGSTYNN